MLLLDLSTPCIFDELFFTLYFWPFKKKKNSCILNLFLNSELFPEYASSSHVFLLFFDIHKIVWQHLFFKISFLFYVHIRFRLCAMCMHTVKVNGQFNQYKFYLKYQTWNLNHLILIERFRCDWLHAVRNCDNWKSILVHA